MKIFLTFLCLFSLLQAYAGVEEELLVQYQKLHPYHESIRDPMPVQRCENRSIKYGRSEQNHCWIEVEYEDSSEAMRALLKKTKESFDTSEHKFLSSGLGREYSHLKNFIDIYDRMEKCKEPNPEDSALSDEAGLMLSRFEESSSEAVSPASSCESCHAKSSPFPAAKKTRSLLAAIVNLFSTDKNLEEAEFQDEIFSQALKKSIQSRVLMESQFNPENFSNPRFSETLVNKVCQKPAGDNKLCRKEDKALLKHLIEEAKSSTEPVESRPNITNNVNQSIAHLNNILEEYNSERKILLEQKRKEKEKLPKNITRRPYSHRINIKYAAQLKRLKESVFREYQLELAQIYNTADGRILRTNAIHTASGFNKLEEMNSKLLGIQGFEETTLTNKDEFSRLLPIDKNTAEKALNETFSRSNQSLQDLLEQNQQKQNDDQEYKNQLKQMPNLAKAKELDAEYRRKRMKDIEDLLIIHPDIISRSLVQNPKYTPIICTAVKNVSNDRRKKALFKNSVTLAGGVGSLAIAVVAPYLGFVGLPVALSAIGAAVTGAAADYAFRSQGASEHRKLKEKMLNAYLAETGDSQSIEDIRSEWRKALAEDLHAKWAIGFGLFDITRGGKAIRQTIIHSSQSAKRSAAAQITRNRILLFNISQNRMHEEALITLLKTQSNLEVRNFLRAVSLFPPKKQSKILSELPHMASNPQLNLVQLTSELKKQGIKANLSSFLVRYTRCLNCKAKPTIKIQKGKQNPHSIREQSR